MLNHSNQKKKKNYYYNVDFFLCVIFSILVDHYFVIDWNNCLFLNAVTQLLTSYYNSNDFFFQISAQSRCKCTKNGNGPESNLAFFFLYNDILLHILFSSGFSSYFLWSSIFS